MNEVATKWLFGLAQATSSADPVTSAKVSVMAALIGPGFPDAAFTTRSLEAVASDCRYWPSYAELRTLLAAWWRDNQPVRPAIAGPVNHGMDDMDHRWVAYYRLREREGFSNSPSQATDPRAHVLSLVKVNSPRAWSVLTGISLTPRAVPTEDEKARVSRTLRPLSELVVVQVAA